MGEARRFSCPANWIHDKWTLLAQIQINNMIFHCLMSIFLGSWVFSFLLGGGEEFYGWQLCSFLPQWPLQCLLYHGKRLRVNFPTWGIRPQNGEENDQYVKPGLKCELEDPNYYSEELTILLRFGGFFPASLLQLAIWFFPKSWVQYLLILITYPWPQKGILSSTQTLSPSTQSKILTSCCG